MVTLELFPFSKLWLEKMLWKTVFHFCCFCFCFLLIWNIKETLQVDFLAWWSLFHMYQKPERLFHIDRYWLVLLKPLMLVLLLGKQCLHIVPPAITFVTVQHVLRGEGARKALMFSCPRQLIGFYSILSFFSVI